LRGWNRLSVGDGNPDVRDSLRLAKQFWAEGHDGGEINWIIGSQAFRILQAADVKTFQTFVINLYRPLFSDQEREIAQCRLEKED
jgi:hypothetical protein